MARPRRSARARRRHQAAASASVGHRRTRGRIPARGPRRRRAQSHQHPDGLRRRRSRRRPVSGDGVSRRRVAEDAARARPAHRRCGARHRAADVAGARCGACPGHRPSRSQAREHLSRSRPAGEDPRLRSGELARRSIASIASIAPIASVESVAFVAFVAFVAAGSFGRDDTVVPGRHSRLHGARAGAGPGGGRTRGHLRAGRGAVRNARRPPVVRAGQHARDIRCGADRRGADPFGHEPGGSRRAVGRHAPLPGEIRRRSLCGRGRSRIRGRGNHRGSSSSPADHSSRDPQPAGADRRDGPRARRVRPRSLAMASNERTPPMGANGRRAGCAADVRSRRPRRSIFSRARGAGGRARRSPGAAALALGLVAGIRRQRAGRR